MKVHYLVGSTASICGCNSVAAAWTSSDGFCQRCESSIDKAFDFIISEAKSGNVKARKFCQRNNLNWGNNEETDA